MYVHVYDPEPEPEPYSDKMSDLEPSSNFPVPPLWLKGCPFLCYWSNPFTYVSRGYPIPSGNVQRAIKAFWLTIRGCWPPFDKCACCPGCQHTSSNKILIGFHPSVVIGEKMVRGEERKNKDERGKKEWKILKLQLKKNA